MNPAGIIIAVAAQMQTASGYGLAVD